MKTPLLLLLASLMLSACAGKQKIMDVSAVSMTQPFVPEGSKLQDKGPVTGQFCPSSDDKGSVGLFDQVVQNAQQTNHVDFITNVSFWKDASGCVLLEGTGQKLMR